MLRLKRVFVVLFVTILAGCTTTTETVTTMVEPAKEIAPVQLTILQLNDIYEITPVEGGKRGGPARVATLKKKLLEKNPNTWAMLAGDFLSPSALGTAKVDGKRLAGAQMVAVLNAMGLDYATYGNHEFDISEEDLLVRLDEMEFEMVVGNVSLTSGDPLESTVPHVIRTIYSGTDSARVGIIGACMTSAYQDYIQVTDPLESLRKQAQELAPKVDFLIGLTHVSLDEDIEAAKTIPELDLILGGHEHENVLVRRGGDFTPIAKADANVRSVYVHHITFKDDGSKKVESKFVVIDERLPDDPATSAVADEWLAKGYSGFEASGFSPEEVVVTTTDELDGLEATVRNESSKLTTLIADAIYAESADLAGAVYNSGSVRIDDVLPPGPLTQYDVIRILPFGGDIVKIRIHGALLDSVVTQGIANKGTGGYLQLAGIRYVSDVKSFTVGDRPLDRDSTYVIAIADFLLSGRETGLSYLTRDNPGVEVLETGRDIRMAVIDELKRRYP